MMVVAESTNLPAATNLVVFGADGNLAQTKLLPAINGLGTVEIDRKRAQAPDRSTVDDWHGRSESELQERLGRQAGHDGATRQLEIHQIRYAADQRIGSGILSALQRTATWGRVESDATYEYVSRRLRELGSLAHHFYCALPPGLYGVVAEKLARHELLSTPQGANGTMPRLIVEKPFGTDGQSARDLLASWAGLAGTYSLASTQMVLVDHYQYKPLLEQWIELRSRAMHDGIWRQSNITRVQVAVAESEDINKDVETYQQLGALGDMTQSHLLKLLCATIANPQPLSGSRPEIDWRAEDVAGEEVLHTLGIDDGDSVILGQYDNANLDSKCETFAGLRLRSDAADWKGVQFVLITGKRLRERTAKVAVTLADRSEVAFCIQPKPQITVAAKGTLGSQVSRIVRTVGSTSDDLAVREQPDGMVVLNQEGDAGDPAKQPHRALLRDLFVAGEPRRRVSGGWAIAAWRVVDDARQRALALALEKYEPDTTDGPRAAQGL